MTRRSDGTGKECYETSKVLVVIWGWCDQPWPIHPVQINPWDGSLVGAWGSTRGAIPFLCHPPPATSTLGNVSIERMLCLQTFSHLHYPHPGPYYIISGPDLWEQSPNWTPLCTHSLIHSLHSTWRRFSNNVNQLVSQVGSVHQQIVITLRTKARFLVVTHKALPAVAPLLSPTLSVPPCQLCISHGLSQSLKEELFPPRLTAISLHGNSALRSWTIGFFAFLMSQIIWPLLRDLHWSQLCKGSPNPILSLTIPCVCSVALSTV